MKICFITFEYPPFLMGGAGVYAANVVKALSALGHEVYVIAPTHKYLNPMLKKEKNVWRVPIIDLPGLRYISFQLRLRKTFLNLVKNVNGIDILHFNTISGAAVAGLLKIPQVVTIHHSAGDINQRLPTSFVSGLFRDDNLLVVRTERKIMSIADGIIAVSHATQRFLVNCYDVPADKISIIHNGVHASLYDYSRKDIKETRIKFGINDDTKLILCSAGRIDEPRKGIKYLLKALSRVYPKMESVCIITGSGKQDAFVPYLKILPEEKTKFVGFLDNTTKRKLFAACDVFVIPSLLEGCPMVALEAMAAAVPIVATNAGGTSELITDGRNGILVEPSNPGQLSKALLSLLSDKKRSEEIKRNNYIDARKLDWSKVAKMVEDVYTRVLDMNDE